MVSYFLDTYALIEIIKANDSYLKFIDEECYTSIFNLYELYYTRLRNEGETKAEDSFNRFRNILIKFSDKDIFAASKFKFQNKKYNISYTDALGYIIALENNMTFVTGDKEFKDKSKVEFVK